MKNLLYFFSFYFPIKNDILLVSQLNNNHNKVIKWFYPFKFVEIQIFPYTKVSSILVTLKAPVWKKMCFVIFAKRNSILQKVILRKIFIIFLYILNKKNSRTDFSFKIDTWFHYTLLYKNLKRKHTAHALIFKIIEDLWYRVTIKVASIFK